MNEVRDSEQTHKTLIMIVDDNPEFLSGIKLTLEMEGFAVLTAMDGQQALNELREQNQSSREFIKQPDLILVDIMMPVMDGYVFYEQVRADPYLNHIPVIFLTAKSSDVDIRYGKELGAEDYLSKLASTEDLLASIRGRLKRIEQRRTLLTQFVDEPGTSLKGGIIIALVVIGALLILAFYLGSLFS
ncbi:MAG: response regulator [Chloroflexi bacterium]|nr:response regulator [Chloroflexota bacterium]